MVGMRDGPDAMPAGSDAGCPPSFPGFPIGHNPPRKEKAKTIRGFYANNVRSVSLKAGLCREKNNGDW